MYCAQGRAALKDGLEHVSIETIQACILVGNNCFGDGDADAESLYFGTVVVQAVPVVMVVARHLLTGVGSNRRPDGGNPQARRGG